MSDNIIKQRTVPSFSIRTLILGLVLLIVIRLIIQQNMLIDSEPDTLIPTGDVTGSPVAP